MKLSEIMNKLNLENVNKKPVNTDENIESGYTSDLLSQVMRGAAPRSIWITIQSHLNIIGVAAMADIAAIIVSDGLDVPGEVIDKADDEEIALFKSPLNAFQISGKLYECGLK